MPSIVTTALGGYENPWTDITNWLMKPLPGVDGGNLSTWGGSPGANAYQLFQQRVLHTKFDIYVLSYQSITLSTQPHMHYIVVTIFGCYIAWL